MAASSVSTEIPEEFGNALLSGEKVEKRLTIKVPGSTANLGPAFDTIGIALDVYSWFDFCVLHEDDKSVPLFRQCGAVAKQLPADKSNLIYKILANSIKDKALLDRIRISVYTNIPLERGLGSSGSAIIGTIYAAARLNGDSPSTEQLLADASVYENHIDNLSASLMGNLVISHKSDTEITTTTLEWPKRWKLVVLVPSYAVSTTSARAVLPGEYKRADVVENLQRVALLTTAICNQNGDLFKRALVDKIHEPYRIKLIPDLANLREALTDKPVLGSALSGAGSAMLVVVDKDHYEETLKFLKEWTTLQTASIGVIEANVDSSGLTVVSDD